MLPMLATPAHRPGDFPTGQAWSYEVKWDGMRVITEEVGGRLRMTSRRGNAVTAAFPELHLDLPEGMIVDGEVVALAEGSPSFQALAGRIHVRDPRRAARLATSVPVTYMVFDLLRLDGQDLTGRPHAHRRKLLEELRFEHPRWQVPPVFPDGQLLLQATLAQGLEGVVAKRSTSKYYPGRRSPDWLKLAHRSTLTCAVAGWTPQTDSPVLGAVWMAVPDGAGRWRCLGRCGAGLVGAAGAQVKKAIRERVRSSTPYAEVPVDPEVRRTEWVEPVVLIDVQYLGADDSGRLRQPVFRGVRTDLTVADLTVADPTAADLTVADLTVADLTGRPHPSEGADE